ncbi:hypothetical protein [Persephonella sp.]
MEVIWKVEEGVKYAELPSLAYITEVNLHNLENGELDVLELYPYFWRFDKDIKNSSISCEEKKLAIKILWSNIQVIKSTDSSWIEAFPKNKEAPLSHWWWHPELWDKDIDIFEVLKDVCPEDKS